MPIPQILTCLIGITSTLCAEEAPMDPGRFEAEVLAMGMDRPMELAVAPDGRVFVVEQSGKVLCYEPTSGSVEVALELEVFADQENGLLGIALDPDFSTNSWVYLCYSPPDHMGQFVSRFVVDGTRIDPSSERVVISWIEQRRECCHHGGSLEFGPEGNLFISTGDNTNPFESSGHAPIDQRAGRFPWDAQRSSANTMTFGGKVLRIRPTASATYVIPPGNLFEDPLVGRPEIYVMGCRNPWRISIDFETGYLYWGDVGPDASNDSDRGPRGYDELNQARGPGFFGWPLFIGANFRYHDYDFTADKIGAPFDPERPWNDSPHNSGARILPPAQPAWIYYPYGVSEEFPELKEGGRTACAGPIYHFDEALASQIKFPRELDDTLFFFEWSRNWLKLVHLDEESGIERIEDFPGGFEFLRPSDMQFGSDGSLYVLEYGTTWGTNEDSKLVRIEYQRGNRKPLAKASADRMAGKAPLKVALSSDGTVDKDGDALEYRWTLQPSGELLSTEANPMLTLESEGQHIVQLDVRDPSGATSTSRLPLAIGNEPPRVDFIAPVHGGFFDPSEALAYHVTVEDHEDGDSEGDSDIKWWMDNVFVEARFEAAAPPTQAGGASFDPVGLALMKESDCFNCHALDRQVVGPALIEIGPHYLDVQDAIDASMQRVQSGSTGVWGEAQMLPHDDLAERDLRLMLEWIYDLDEAAPAGVLRPGHVGEVRALELGEHPAESGALVLEATYTDTGGEKVGAQRGAAKRVLRSHLVEAEHFSTRKGTQSLNSETASGGTFIGAIDNGNYLVFEDVNLAGIRAVRCRVSSAGGGATVEFRSGSTEGDLLGSFEMVPNGEWEAWFDVHVELAASPGARDLIVRFVNEEKSGGLMNLDSLFFLPSAP